MPNINNVNQIFDTRLQTASQRTMKSCTVASASKEDVSEVKDIEKLQFKINFENVYKDISNQIGLSEQIRPRLRFKNMGARVPGGFNDAEGKLYFNDSIMKQLDNEDIVFIIRHELEHVKQFHNMARLLGLEKFIKLISAQENIDPKEINIAYYQKAIQSLGIIDKESPEGIYTQKCIDAYKKYPDFAKLWNRTDICKIKKIFIVAKEFIFNYKFNFLETEANKVAKKFLTNKSFYSKKLS